MSADLLQVVDRFSTAHVLLVGDFMLDRYVIADAGRVSPEAPVARSSALAAPCPRRETTDMFAPTSELIDQLYREEVRAARRMPPEERLLAGPRLFDYACRITMDGIRAQHPDADERRVREILRRRVDLARRLERLA